MYTVRMMPIAHIVIALATAQPTAPSPGKPRWPYMRHQFRKTLHASANTEVYMTGRVSPMPSVVKRIARNRKMPGAPQEMAFTKSMVISRKSGSTPIAMSAGGTTKCAATITGSENAIASQMPWRV